MNPITDEDLILHRYRDGLEAARIDEIDAALAASPALRARRDAIVRAIDAFDAAETVAEAGLGDRIWRGLEPRLAAAHILVERGTWRDRVTAMWHSLQPARLAWSGAFAIVLAIGAGYLLGRRSAVPPLDAPVLADASAARVLDAYVAEHLRATEGVLMTASNSGSATLLDDNRELASALVESNRLYALAAARAGNARLADFLRQLEPVLLSLANQPGAAAVQSSDDLRDYLRATDLLFQVRATEAHLDRGGDRRT